MTFSARSILPALALLAVVAAGPSPARAELAGHYLEARTCEIYTGPCFANGEVGLAGKDAVMAWKFTSGEHRGADLTGLSVVAVIKASHTLGFKGMADAKQARAMIIIDSRADEAQRAALEHFARRETGKAGKQVAQVIAQPIAMKLDTQRLDGSLTAGKLVRLKTRKARPSDCICSNESAYYPPLARVTNFAPGVTTDGAVRARSLGTRWTIPGSRSAYMGMFAY